VPALGFSTPYYMLCFVFNSLRKYVFVCFVDISGNVEEEFENTNGGNQNP
jgi:hypothetical protein